MKAIDRMTKVRSGSQAMSSDQMSWENKSGVGPGLCRVCPQVWGEVDEGEGEGGTAAWPESPRYYSPPPSLAPQAILPPQGCSDDNVVEVILAWRGVQGWEGRTDALG